MSGLVKVAVVVGEANKRQRPSEWTIKRGVGGDGGRKNEKKMRKGEA